MGNVMNCDSCSVNARNMMHQREMMYQKDMRMPRNRDMMQDEPLAMAYVPWQNFGCTYEPAQALQVGTIFPELDKPFYGRRGMRL